MKKETLNDFIINGFYGTFIGADTIARYYKTKLNSIYGKAIFNEKENKTMTNYQWLAISDERSKEFIEDAEKLSMHNFYKKYDIPDKYECGISDVFEWLLKERKPPKTECIDLYKLIKFANNPALFNLDESVHITTGLYKLDRFLYCKDVENDSYVVKRSNAFEVVISNTRQIRKSLIETEFDKLPKLTFNLSEKSYSGRYMRA